MAKPTLMVGLGEVLWDVLPSGKVLGGAPANFAYMANVLGSEGIVASRIGTDELGRETCRAMRALGLNISYLQQDDRHETGTAKVVLDATGQPNFTVTESVAWDFLEWTAAWEELSKRVDVVCFGSLAQRSPESAATIGSFLRNVSERALRVFDVNLRQSFYSKDVLHSSLQQAQVVKLNDQELPRVASLLNLGSGNEEALARRLLNEYGFELVCVTRGAHGSLLVSRTQTVEHPGFRVKVADAIGAGDAFTACLAHYYLRREPLEKLSELANRFASWVATQTGATPHISSGQLHEVLSGPIPQ